MLTLRYSSKVGLQYRMENDSNPPVIEGEGIYVDLEEGSTPPTTQLMEIMRSLHQELIHLRMSNE